MSAVQADAILQMQLRRLTALEADKIRLEHEDLVTKIADYKDILGRRERVLGIIQEELVQLRGARHRLDEHDHLVELKRLRLGDFHILQRLTDRASFALPRMYTFFSCKRNINIMYNFSVVQSA